MKHNLVRILTAAVIVGAILGQFIALMFPVHTLAMAAAPNFDISKSTVHVSRTALDQESESVPLEQAPDELYISNRPYGDYSDGFDIGLQDLLFDACDEFDIPYKLALAVVWKETNFSNIMGDGGRSYGYMQIQKKWHWPEMEALGVDDLLDPLGNFRVGCYILRNNYDYSGTWERALTMYNSGSPGASGYADRVLAKWEEFEN